MRDCGYESVEEGFALGLGLIRIGVGYSHAVNVAHQVADCVHGCHLVFSCLVLE